MATKPKIKKNWRAKPFGYRSQEKHAAVAKDLRENKLTWAQIAAKHGYSLHRLNFIREFQKVPHRYKRKTFCLRRYLPEEFEKLVALYQSGLSIQRSANTLGMHYNLAWKHLVNAGIPRRPFAMRPNEKQHLAIVADLKAGLPRREIVKRNNCSQRLVSVLAGRHGLRKARQS